VGGAVRDQLANTLAVLERRVFSLERRFRDFAANSVKYLHQLLDVRITYEGGSAVADGDVLTYDADLEKWVNAAPAGGGAGPFVSMRAIGSQYDPDPFDGFTSQWSYDAGDPALDLAAIGSGSSRGILVGAAGIYRVTAAGESDSALKVAISGPSWMWDGESDVCRSNYAADEGGDCAAVSMDFAMPEGGAVVVTHTTSGSWVELSLLVELRHLDPSIVDGECGG